MQQQFGNRQFNKIDKHLMIKKTMGGFLLFGVPAVAGYILLWYLGIYRPKKQNRMRIPRNL